MTTALLTILGFVLAIGGVVACFVPILPGPVLSYLALILLSWAKDWAPLGAFPLIILGCLTVFLSVLDNVIPAISAKKTGATRYGIWGSVGGMLLGIFIFPPFGIFFGSFIGAMAGEYLSGARANKAVAVGWGVFVGSMAAMGIKLAFSFTVLAACVIYPFL
jgi:uncharacterized protein